ncbi:ATP-NAD kinase-like domain-containing protein [Roridomyces roridus]|uniref:ATP-NAD kinase-like domain-containing protein n=1 Tax=Roridomyces roridus TaxID=1738132 RepID=A0AAD7BVZ7_9AGAR|nr:ATP-NAD kinase-like domain-containing protein [Roridomyces roridus]
MPLLVLYNPVSGSSASKSFVESHVLPRIEQSGKVIDRVAATEYPGHAGDILVNFLQETSGDVVVVLASGDGTLNECITTLSSAQLTGPRAGSPPKIIFVLIPSGTANALYSTLFPPNGTPDDAYRLQSLDSFLAGSKTRPLTLAITLLSSPPSARKQPQVRISAVVVSTSLHASILKDSEALRKEMPGIERFKVAAERNSKTWYNSSVKLIPTPGAEAVQVYDPATKSFVDHPDSDEDDPIVDMYGPFAYFLATCNVDRLEPAFMISPLASRIPPTEAACDLVIVRPFQSPTVSTDTLETRDAFVPVLWSVLGAAYRNGSHVDLRYNANGEATSEGQGPPVVEYIRCGGWEWIPDDDDEKAHYLCNDGAISKIETEGRAVCSAATPQDKAGFLVHV